MTGTEAAQEYLGNATVRWWCGAAAPGVLVQPHQVRSAVKCHGEHPVASISRKPWKPLRLERCNCGCVALHISFGFGTVGTLSISSYSVTASARLLQHGERQHVSCGSRARLKRADTWVLWKPCNAAETRPARIPQLPPSLIHTALEIARMASSFRTFCCMRRCALTLFGSACGSPLVHPAVC